MSDKIQPARLGLKPHQYALIANAIYRDSSVESAAFFGSRAMGNFKDSSDVDIVLIGEKVTFDTVAHILDEFENSTLPYSVDLVIKHKISSEELLAHIKQYGIEIDKS